MKNVIFVLLGILIIAEIRGQTPDGSLTGTVSFVSSSNIYVRFTSTSGISAGDTLYIISGDKLIPALKVNNLSSTSCLCTLLSTMKISAGDLINARKKNGRIKTDEKIIDKAAKEMPDQNVPVAAGYKKYNPDELKQKIRGSLSAFSYSDFSNTAAPSSTRFRYTFSMDAKNIGNSRFSVESYISFYHKLGDWSVVKSDLFNALKIYSLSVIFDLNKTTRISAGRRINMKLSNIGAMDGVQIEKSFGNFSMGLMGGTRPDYTNYSFDSKLLQYGGYLAYNTKSASSYSETSLAFMQQMDSMKIDRRFLYFQHSNSITKNLYFFGTLEVDLYEMKFDSLNTGHSKNTFNPTGIYASLRYRVTDNFTISGSYDARKNVVYYETYKTFLDRIIESEMRQGFRLQANYRITRNLALGVQSGYRYLKSDPHPSKNVYGYLTYSQIPGAKISATLSATYLQSSYMNGKIFGLTLNRDFFNGKAQTGIGYRYVDYSLPENQLVVPQNIGEINFTWLFARTMSFSANYEGTFEKKNTYDRIYLQIRKRF